MKVMTLVAVVALMFLAAGQVQAENHETDEVEGPSWEQTVGFIAREVPKCEGIEAEEGARFQDYSVENEEIRVVFYRRYLRRKTLHAMRMPLREVFEAADGGNTYRTQIANLDKAVEHLRADIERSLSSEIKSSIFLSCEMVDGSDNRRKKCIVHGQLSLSTGHLKDLSTLKNVSFPVVNCSDNHGELLRAFQHLAKLNKGTKLF